MSVRLDDQDLDALRKSADSHRLTASTLRKESEVASMLRHTADEMDAICARRDVPPSASALIE